MNFLLRSTTQNHITPPPDPETATHPPKIPKPTMTLEGLIAEDPYTDNSASEDQVDENVQDDGLGGQNDSDVGESRKNDLPIAQKHLDVSDKEGWIIIPNKLLPNNWKDAQDISSFHHLDRSFVFPGEQVHILACLSACKKDTEIITPFKVAAMMNKNGRSTKSQNDNVENKTHAESGQEKQNPCSQDKELNGDILVREDIQQQKDVTSGESLLRLEDHKRQTEMLLQTFTNSHFFVRTAESDEPLWSKRISLGSKNTSVLNAVIDRGNFNSSVSGGVARDAVECCCLPNGDIVVLIQVNVGADYLKDPILEILQFEKHQDRYRSSERSNNNRNQDPCEDLLKWLLPIDNTVAPLGRPLSPPRFSSSSSGSSTAIKSSFSASFGHLRSYSMSSLPQSTSGSPLPVTNSSSRPNFNLDDWDRFSSQKAIKSQKVGNEGLLSFRGVSLEPDRFSVCCGLEGIYIPGRRWRKKVEIVQPVDIHSFAVDCNTDDLLCVQIKNVSPAHVPDLMIYIDAITIVFEEASKGGPPTSVPIACIEAGNNHSLPNLALRRGEVHSFILKPATCTWRNSKVRSGSSPQSSHSQAATALSNLCLPSKVAEGKNSPSTADQYSVLISCRCNYSESKLFFKQQTSWRPRNSRDLMISVASQIARPSFGSCGSVSELPVQVLNLQASNLTSEDLTLTVLAPASFTSSPSVVSLNSSPSSPASPFIDFSEFTGNVSGEKNGSISQNGDSGARSGSFSKQTAPTSDVISNTGLNCSHLWLQSRIPLGCVPPQSTATIKLELLPLTDGIITPDTLQIRVKEKGVTYIPEHSLKINATSGISTGIL